MSVLQECEIPIMIIECCSQEKTFVRYYALLGSRFCMVKREFQVGPTWAAATWFWGPHGSGQLLQRRGVSDCGWCGWAAAGHPAS
jgi:hypothetical protein